MDEVTTLQLEDDFVDGVEQVGHPACERIFDQRDRLDVRRLAHEDRHHRPGGFEARVRGAQRQVVLENAHELAEVGIHPIAAGALALLDD